jgi:hypothetical protein
MLTKTARILLGALVLAGAVWCLYLLIPTREWVHVASCTLIPGTALGYAVSLARRGMSEVADAVLWMALLMTMSYVAFASTVADFYAT